MKDSVMRNVVHSFTYSKGFVESGGCYLLGTFPDTVPTSWGSQSMLANTILKVSIISSIAPENNKP